MKICFVQIQTIDACNAACRMCPYKSISHSGKIMDMKLFKRIIHELKKEIDNEIITPNLNIHLYFQNEPLLDPLLFERVQYVKKILPHAYTIFSTNGLLVPKYAPDIIASNFTQIYISLYGYDSNSYNYITQSNISPEDYQYMIQSITYIKLNSNLVVKVSPSWKKKNGEWTLFEYSSRAGFYTNTIYHHTIRGCKRKRNNEWINFHINGDMIICCMDWKKEVIIGNICEQTLNNIFNSPTYREMLLKTTGKIKSEFYYICKRCEWALI